MPVHRSRYELERVLGRYGASDLAFVELDANASIQFAIHGRYVQLQLPLPDPSAARFTHTPSGRPRTVAAQERAYEQALREHWRALLLAVRGKLQTVESGISTFEDEFAGFLVPHYSEDTNRRRKKPKAVDWLLGTSHTLAVALVAAFLVPASAVSAFALPPSVVGQLSAPFGSVLEDETAGDGSAHTVALGAGNWSGSDPSDDESLVIAVEDSGSVQRKRHVPKASPSETSHATAPTAEASTSGDGGVSEASAGESSSSSSGGGAGTAPSAPTASENGAPRDGGGAPSGGGAKSPKPRPDGELASSEAAPSEAGKPGPADTGNPPSAPGKDKDKGHDNGNHSGADNGNKNGADGAGDGKGNETAPGKEDDDNGQHNGADNGAKAGETGSGNGKEKPSAGQ